ncbi:MAG: DUF4232 domain-containing protein [Candidatus Dormibacteraceae bacterium]
MRRLRITTAFSTRVTHLLTRSAAVVALAVLLAACGSNSPSGNTSPTPTPTAQATPTPQASGGSSGGVTRCLVSQLSLSAGQPSAGAGSIQQAFVLTNKSQISCALIGYPGMQMLGSGGAKIPTTVVRTPGTKQTVTLAPGGTASFLAQWHDQTGYATPCATSQQVEVTPPNAYKQLVITQSIQACPNGQINVTAVAAGSTGGQ